MAFYQFQAIKWQLSFAVDRWISKLKRLYSFSAIRSHYLLDLYSFHNSWIWRFSWELKIRLYNIYPLRIFWNNYFFHSIISSSKTSWAGIRFPNVYGRKIQLVPSMVILAWKIKLINVTSRLANHVDSQKLRGCVFTWL